VVIHIGCWVDCLWLIWVSALMSWRCLQAGTIFAQFGTWERLGLADGHLAHKIAFLPYRGCYFSRHDLPDDENDLNLTSDNIPTP